MLNQETAPTRYWAAIAAQIAGINLFVAIGILTFPATPDIAVGLRLIVAGMWLVLLVSLPAFLFPFIQTWRKNRISFVHEDVDRMILTLFLTDICMHTFLVCQQGGLNRSMFLPVFFLLPMAYTLVERREGKRRLLCVFSITIISVIISYLVSWWVTSRGLTALPVIRIPITRFSDWSPRSFTNALLITSLASLLIPIMQMEIIQLSKRKEAD
jgi:hypothetical protein